MTEPKPSTTRRDFLKTTGQVAAASALAGVAIPSVHAGEDNTIQVALVGCGGRGTGAAANALSTKSGPIKLVAMADVFEDRLEQQLRQPRATSSTTRSTCPRTASSSASTATRRRWTACKPGDVVILATPPAFRWVHFSYAIEKGLNVFMEKPVTVDGPTTRKMLALGEEVGQEEPQGRRRPDVPPLRGPRELFDRIKDGEIGDIIAAAGLPHAPARSASAFVRAEARRTSAS